MANRRLLLVSILSVALVLACEKSKDPAGPDDLKIAILAGNWVGISYEFTNKADSAQKIDVVAEGWLSYSMEIKSNGQFTRITSSAIDQVTETGTLRIQGGNLILRNDGNVTEYTLAFSLSRSTLSLTDDNASFDFDFDGAEEPATAVLVLTRRS